MIIRKEDVLKLLYSSFPEFKIVLENEYDEDEIALLYVVTGRFAKYLLDSYRSGNRKILKSAGELIESFHINGDDYVRELANIGFIEGIQNVWDNNGIDAELFYEYLLPKSQEAWDKLKVFWSKVIAE